jgi:hypothetical protein
MGTQDRDWYREELKKKRQIRWNDRRGEVEFDEPAKKAPLAVALSFACGAPVVGTRDGAPDIVFGHRRAAVSRLATTPLRPGGCIR